ncbi:hypothetical protein DT250_03260 [Bacillus sp. AR2-1]|uniref:hypothetical protein n=1 Tax=Bacillus sp. AR2-1 TaxID=2217816 RepID=UPI0011EC1F63|nr:hypothetical protein [Bacillus sp. AR2-1]KAA0777189.1 hypothetical protein DT250_03260 [Bacillus sp. AR2-1]
MYITITLMKVRAFSFTVPAACGDNGDPKEFTEANFENAKGGNTKHIKKYRSLIDKGPVLFCFI